MLEFGYFILKTNEFCVLPSELDLGSWALHFIQNACLEFRGSRLNLYKILKFGYCTSSFIIDFV